MKERRHKLGRCRPQGRQGQGLPTGGLFLQTTDSGLQTKFPLDIPHGLSYHTPMRRNAILATPDVARLVSRLGNSRLGGFISDDRSRGGFSLLHRQVAPSVPGEVRGPFVEDGFGYKQQQFLLT